MVYLVRSGTKQPKPFTASAADQARLFLLFLLFRFPFFLLFSPRRSPGVRIDSAAVSRLHMPFRQSRQLLLRICCVTPYCSVKSIKFSLWKLWMCLNIVFTQY